MIDMFSSSGYLINWFLLCCLWWPLCRFACTISPPTFVFMRWYLPKRYSATLHLNDSMELLYFQLICNTSGIVCNENRFRSVQGWCAKTHWPMLVCYFRVPIKYPRRFSVKASCSCPDRLTCEGVWVVVWGLCGGCGNGYFRICGCNITKNTNNPTTELIRDFRSMKRSLTGCLLLSQGTARVN